MTVSREMRKVPARILETSPSIKARPRAICWTCLEPKMRRSIELLASLLFCGCTATAGPSHDGQPASVGGSGNAGGSGSTWTPGAPQPSVVVSTPRLVRLSRLQWENSVRDLLQLADVSDVTG